VQEPTNNAPDLVLLVTSLNLFFFKKISLLVVDIAPIPCCQASCLLSVVLRKKENKKEHGEQQEKRKERRQTSYDNPNRLRKK